MRSCPTFLLILLCAQWVGAATYFVRTDGNNANAGTANNAGGAWATVDFASDNVAAGDTIYIDTGDYTANITPSDNGSAGGGYITYVATNGLVRLDGITFVDGNTRLRFCNLTVDASLNGVEQNGCVTFAGTTSFIEFWHCKFTNSAANGFRGGTGIITTNFITVGCHFADFGSDGGASAVSVSANDFLMLGNTITNCRPDGVIMFGDRWRVLNTFLSGLSQADGGHPDLFQTGSGGNSYGWEFNLVEGTFQKGSGVDGDEHVGQFSHGQAPATEQMGNNIFRFNVWHNNGTGGLGINQTTEGSITNIFLYNNSSVFDNRHPDAVTTRYGDTFIGAQTDYIFYKNNLLYEVWGTSATSNLEVVYDECTNFEKDYNLAYDPDGSVTFHSMWSSEQANEQSNANPQLADVANDDFSIGSTSAARDNGGWLTGVSSASNTGTTFAVTNGGYFRGDNAAMTQYGGNLVVGDTITVGTDVLTISSISGNDITVTESFTWAAGDKVYYGSDTTPDIGALPYGYSKLTSAVYTTGGVVTPNATARLVIQFRAGIPIAVDNSSPYEFTHQTGDVYRAYALYPSDIPWVEATLLGGTGPSYSNRGIGARARTIP